MFETLQIGIPSKIVGALFFHFCTHGDQVYVCLDTVYCYTCATNFVVGKVVFTGGSYEVGMIYGIVPYHTVQVKIYLNSCTILLLRRNIIF
jgi:hypothetical protein